MRDLTNSPYRYRVVTQRGGGYAVLDQTTRAVVGEYATRREARWHVKRLNRDNQPEETA